MAGRVEGKVALVTGGASGIGRATALTFAREGAKLVVADMNADGGHQTVHMITENGGEATFVQVDVTSASAVEAMISKTVETYGRLDCAHNNAGIAGGLRARTADYPEDRWHQVIAVNLTGVWLCMKYEIPQMLSQGGGTIVNMASIAGLIGGAGGAAYAASKHGVIGLTRALATELASQGHADITVNTICPGYVRAGMGVAPQKVRSREGAVMDVPGEEIFERHIKRRVPQRRMIEAEEIAHAAVFLALPESRGITGQGLNVDGGFIMS